MSLTQVNSQNVDGESVLWHREPLFPTAPDIVEQICKEMIGEKISFSRAINFTKYEGKLLLKQYEGRPELVFKETAVIRGECEVGNASVDTACRYSRDQAYRYIAGAASTKPTCSSAVASM